MEPPDPAAALGSKHDRMANGAGGSSSGGGSGSSSSGAAGTPAAGEGMGIEAPKRQEATNGDGTSRPSKRRGLLAIVYSEFDNTLGPTIRFQAPDGYVRVRVCVCGRRARDHPPTNSLVDQCKALINHSGVFPPQLPLPGALRRHIGLRHHGPAALRARGGGGHGRLSGAGIPPRHREREGG